ncbi:MAG: sugar-binding protein, partial [Planctomycetota bacterium]
AGSKMEEQGMMADRMRCWTRIGVLVALMVAGMLAFHGGTVMAGGGMGHNKELYVVPAPEGVTVDGSLEDWDFSGHINYYVVPETRETQSGKVAMMYDGEALYIGGVVRDSSPMMNRHDPKTKPSRAWDADVCQIFFSLDPDDEQPLAYSSFKKEHKNVSPVATMMLWYFTDRQEPSLAMFQGMGFTKALRPDLYENGYVPPEHFEAAYKQGEDGLSYTFEYRIPWTTLKMKRVPEARDTLAASMAIFWGRRDGLKTAGGSAWAWNLMAQAGFPYQSSGVWGTLKFWPEGDIPREWVEKDLPPEQPLPLTFAYSLPREGECTVQLFNEANESVRIIVPQQRRPEGANRERWDGLDKDGKPLPAGTYSWRGVVHDPIKTKYRFSVHNSGQPPYPTEDNTGGWGGDHGAPTTVLAIKNGMVLAWGTCEFGWGVIRVDLKGKKLWGSKRTAEHLATDGKRLFLAGGHGWSNTGGVTAIELSSSRTLNFQPGMEALVAPEGGDKETNTVTGLACDGERIYVAYGKRDLLGVFDLDGNLAETWSVPAPGRLAMRPDGSLAAVQNDGVVFVRDGKAGDPVITGLDEPRGLAVSDAGEVFVALAGTVQQVQVFSPEGKRLRAPGKAGGRPAKGRYDPAGMYEPGGIDVD